MASKIKVDQIEGSTGSSITIPSGQTLTIADGLAASTIGSGTLSSDRLPTVPVTKGGTGLTSLGTAGQVVKVNSGANALEFGTAPSGKVLQYVGISDNTEYEVNAGTSPNAVQGTAADLTITPSSTSSRILVTYHWGGIHSHQAGCLGYGKIYFNTGGGSFNEVTPVGANTAVSGTRHHFKITLETSDFQARPITYGFIHHPNTTSEVKYRPYYWTEGSGGYIYINRSARNAANDASTVMFAYAMELQG